MRTTVDFPSPEIERLLPLLGVEHDLGEVARRLYEFASSLEPPVVGAMHVTCADESEIECVEAFRLRFAEHLLPSLKFGNRAVFRLASLGGRYEWGAMAIAEDHFATAITKKTFKLMMVKINSHVSMERGKSGVHFGHMDRYHRPSVYCGALHALMQGGGSPFLKDLEETFSSEGIDRVAALRDETRVKPEHRGLFAALANARLQARRALVDLQDAVPRTPTIFAVLPCVTLNRKHADTEIVCGVYWADRRGQDQPIVYRGLGDDPAAYLLDHERGRIQVTDRESDITRLARDHREQVGKAYLARVGQPPRDLSPEPERAIDEERTEKRHGPDHARQRLWTALEAAARRSPVSAAVMMFAGGFSGIHNLFRAHRLARGLAADREARRMLIEIEAQVEGMPHETVQAILEALAAHHGLGRGAG